MKKIAMLIVFAAIVFLIGLHFPKIITYLLYIFSIFTPLILGFCIAFVLNVFMRSIENVWGKFLKKDSKLKRPLSLILTLFFVFLVIFIVMFLIIPEISRTISTIVELFPSYINTLEKNINAFVETNSIGYIDLSSLSVDFEKMADSVAAFISNSSESFFNATLNVTTSIFNTFFNILLGFILSLYMLVHKEKLCRHLKKLLYAYVKKERVEKILNVTDLSNRVFSKFVTGQMLEAVLIGLMCFTGMVILQLPYAAMISTLVGFTSLIPVVGALFGTAVGALLIFLVNPIQAVWFILFIIVMNQTENNLIYPKLMGKTMGLPGIWVLVAVIIGGRLYGIIGMLISVPLCSVLYILLRDEVNRRLRGSTFEDIEEI